MDRRSSSLLALLFSIFALAQNPGDNSGKSSTVPPKQPFETKQQNFAGGRQLLLDHGVPFDPDRLLSDGWREELKGSLAAMPEMHQVRYETGQMQGVYIADTLYLRAPVHLAGPTVFLVNYLVFEGCKRYTFLLGGTQPTFVDFFEVHPKASLGTTLPELLHRNAEELDNSALPSFSTLGFASSCSAPIVIDTTGEGIHLTSPATGVQFDVRANHHPVQIAWTAPDSRNAFLALPGPDGLVHNAKQLFGNLAPESENEYTNELLVLADFDKPENGGNGDGIIDDHDAVFSSLRLWIDANHDGICQPEELHRLPDLGVYSLALKYEESRRTDQFGNQFRYRARVNPGERRDPRDQTPSGDPGRWAYDGFFVSK